ncbi:MAG: hypothetical protein WDZ41_02495 [Candidatus Babeliales bacterium]
MLNIILAFLILALITGILGFGGFIAGAGIILVLQILFFIFVISLVISVVRHFFFTPPHHP